MGWICKHIYRLMVTIITTRLVGKSDHNNNYHVSVENCPDNNNQANVV